MKKLLVVLAVLFATVGYTYADTKSATGEITGTVTCPIRVSVSGAIDFTVPAGGTISNFTEAEYLDFAILGCVTNETTGSYAAVGEDANLKMAVTCTVAEDNVAPKASDDVNETVVLGTWTVDGTVQAQGNSYTSPEGGLAFDGNIPLRFTLNSVDATAQHYTSAKLVWDVTVNATPIGF